MKRKYWVRWLDSFSDNLKWVGLVALALAFVLCGAAADAQQPKKLARICYLGNTVTTTAEIIKPFQQRLRELGYVEGQNLLIDYRYFEGQIARLPDLAAEFVRLNCDVIVTQGTEPSEAAKNATKTVPVVMAFGGDAVRLGLVASLAHPGGNITGMASMGADIYGKRLELLKETVPKLARVAFLWSPTNPASDYYVTAMETVAKFLRLELQSLEVHGPDDFEGAFQAATKKRAQALLLGGGGLFGAHRSRIVELAAKNRLPGSYVNLQYVDAGGLMFYGEDRAEMYRRAAEIVDKVLKGTNPADIPVERPKKFDFVINLKAAKRIGLTVPPNVLVRATRVIR